MDAISLNIFSGQMNSICSEMGAVLQRSSFSPNIKDRLDFSCAIFDQGGELCAQAAHIPVHLGSMAFAMRNIVGAYRWRNGDMLIVNDPYLGGTHLPDVTLIAPVFVEGELVAFVANRAHHADIGANSPGSMPISCSLEDEGVIIAPTKLIDAGRLNTGFMTSLLSHMVDESFSKGDFLAQISANRIGVVRLFEFVTPMGRERFLSGLRALNEYGARMARRGLGALSSGVYCFSDEMDDDGLGNRRIPIRVEVTVVDGGKVHVDFSGTAPQVEGNINAPLSVAAAAVYYVFRCLMPEGTPACAGTFSGITLFAPEGCLLNARRPAAVTAGNVETSTRVVDVVLGALAKAAPELIPAASHGSMNNVAMGARGDGVAWNYYETIGGGMGAGAKGGGLSGVQTHMTNTLNTPIESLEMHFPMRIRNYALRRGSGGRGKIPGGDGLIREFEFLDEAELTLITERRGEAVPWGLLGGEAGERGINLLDGVEVPSKVSMSIKAGQRLLIKTPGGGGWGYPD